MSFLKHIPTFIGILSTLVFTIDTMLGGSITTDLIETIGNSSVIDTVTEYVSVIGSGILNSFSHFDLFTLFTRDNIAFVVGIWGVILISRVVSCFSKKGANNG